MGYRDDFYKSENIIGYTGNVANLNIVTVYFKSGNSFGRITQEHSNVDNIGRNKVREYADYAIYNHSSNGNNAVEFYDGKVQHNSRNPFIPVGNDQILRAGLAQSIVDFQAIKPKYQ
ncbi:MAG: hypothetical protein WC149_03775 [Arcobacteraceae bacterium]